MRVAGLIGDPVEHSLSPAMHNAAFRHFGIDARYDLWPTAAAGLGARIAELRGRDVLGANVTVPHKGAVMSLVDEVSDTAMRIGAVNTIVPRDGRLLGDNTDAYGFGQSLRAVVGNAVPASALVVGAGGASRAVIVALQDAGVMDIQLVNRTFDRAGTLAAELSVADRPTVTAAVWSDLETIAFTVGILVNATSVGWHGDELPFEAGVVYALPGEATVFDLTYRRTGLVKLAAARGLRASDGLPMLIHQGARAFEMWTSRPAPVEIMTLAVREACAARA